MALQTFRKTEIKPGAVGTQAASAELAKLRRIGQYKTPVFARRTGGGSGSGKRGVTALWNQVKEQYELYTAQLEKDLAEINETHRLGLVDGAMKDVMIIERFKDFEEKIHGQLVNENNAILISKMQDEMGDDMSIEQISEEIKAAKEVIEAKASTAPSTVTDWIASTQNKFDRLKSQYGVLEEPRRFDAKQSPESIQAQNDLLERRQYIAETEAGRPYYIYKDQLVAEDGKVVSSLAQNKNITIDVWGPNGYEQVSVADLKSDDYTTDIDPSTGSVGFYRTESETEKGKLVDVDRTYVWLKGANGTPLRVEYEDGDQGRMYYYSNEDSSPQPKELSEEETMAYLAGQSMSSWASYPDKETAKTIYQTMSQLPSDGSWIEDSAGSIYRMQDGSLRPVNNFGILNSYKDNNEYFDSQRRMPSFYFQQMEAMQKYGDELRDWSVENKPEELTVPEQQFEEKVVPPSMAPEAPRIQRSMPSLGGEFFQGIQDLIKPGSSATIEEEEPQEPKEERPGLFGNIMRRIF